MMNPAVHNPSTTAPDGPSPPAKDDAPWREPRLARWRRLVRDPKRVLRLLREDRHARAHFVRHPPVFIVGAPRSGTTLLLKILAAQPDCTQSFEPFRIWELVVGRRPDDAISPPLTLGQRARLRTEFFHALEPGRPILIAKDPRDSLRIGAICHAFPTARFIHIVRDGRDVIASVVKAFEAGGTYHVEPGWAHVRFPGYRAMFDAPHHRKAAHMWRICTESVVSAFRDVAPERRMTLRYEDLLADAFTEARRAVTFVTADFSEGALATAAALVSNTVAATPNAGVAGSEGFGQSWVKSDVAADAGSGTFSQSVRSGKWKQELSDDVVKECEPIIAPMMAPFGYETAAPRPDRPANG